LFEGLPERRNPGLTFSIVFGPVHEDANPAHLLGLLSLRGKRPSCR
jgi:hypothetical protein